MTRPTIIRADTIDLQDPGSPSASDHSRQPTQPAPLGIGPAAPHQAAAVKHVEDERQSEEDDLAHQWNGDQNHNGINGNANHVEHATDPNDDADMADSETEDMDDDMLDKISSSPSIDDGGYSLHFTCASTAPSQLCPAISASPASAWPTRSTSLSAKSVTCQSSSCSTSTGSTTSPHSDFSSSSPFTSTPEHLPLVLRKGEDVGFGDDVFSSPFFSSPLHLPLRMESCAHRSSSKDHHHLVNVTPRDPLESVSQDRDNQEPKSTSFSWEESDSGYKEGLDHANEMLDGTGPLQTEPCQDNESDDDAHDTSFFIKPRPLPPLPTSGGMDELEPTSTSYGRISPPEIFERPLDIIEPGSPASSSASWQTDSYASSWNELDDDDDDTHGDCSFLDSERIDSGWGGECLRETEDIDFEFVYALHTFVATVEGQANATKGDTMVLLDDSNSYWWLVRVVKDSSIGYLPAEHIETPTERLARLNKHRNIDLAAAMLGDTTEKSKNPLKKAMRRRNTKTVQFTAPTYVEASEYEYSTDEEDEGDSEVFGNGHVQIEEVREEDHDEDAIAVEPLRIGSKDKSADDLDANKSEEETTGDKYEEQNERLLDAKVSRNGTLRNTDSFFKDDTVETRKISLTPNLLKDDSSPTTTKSESRERGPSLDSLEKELKSPERVKDDKKKKEKKPGMLRGLFGRKDKKAKGSEYEGGEEKHSGEFSRESSSRDSDDIGSPREYTKADSESPQAKEKAKTPPKKPEPKVNGQTKQPAAEVKPPQITTPEKTAAQNAAEATMRLVEAEPESREPDSSEASPLTPTGQEPRARSGSNTAKQAISNMLRSNNNNNNINNNNATQSPENKMPPRQKVIKSKQRVPMDDFDSTPEYENSDPFADPEEEKQYVQQQPLSLLGKDDGKSTQTNGKPEISPIDTSHPDHPPALVGDTSSQDEPDISPVSPSGSPTRGRHPGGPPSATKVLSPTTTGPPPRAPPVAPGAINTSIVPSPTLSGHSRDPSSAASLPPWSDASLRSYLDDGSDIRDMLVVVHDTSGVVPVGPEHPIMSGLFKEERSKVAQMGTQLDSLLGDWLGRKQKARERATKSPPNAQFGKV
ncbi:hypothetical protein JOL62DRAFT_211673 [Phyllosticta paracitricarpa]|uniref:SH3 domain-containing protein n=1 Tax=Phyllosticta paracitricarpa TaxID=2016321 RepID=A0ABR1N028_9PEZI